MLTGSAITAGAATTQCKISVVGGSFKGKTYKLTMQDGKFVGDKGFRESNLQGCLGKKKIYGRWYHICRNSKILVYIVITDRTMQCNRPAFQPDLPLGARQLLRMPTCHRGAMQDAKTGTHAMSIRKETGMPV